MSAALPAWKIGEMRGCWVNRRGSKGRGRWVEISGPLAASVHGTQLYILPPRGMRRLKRAQGAAPAAEIAAARRAYQAHSGERSGPGMLAPSCGGPMRELGSIVSIIYVHEKDGRARLHEFRRPLPRLLVTKQGPKRYEIAGGRYEVIPAVGIVG